jgi:hypothetical protein
MKKVNPRWSKKKPERIRLHKDSKNHVSNEREWLAAQRKCAADDA